MERTLKFAAGEVKTSFQMRVRVTRQLRGSIDGIQLDHFKVGTVYDVGVTVGCYLLAEGAAEPADREQAAVGTLFAAKPPPALPVLERRRVWRPTEGPPALAAERASKPRPAARRKGKHR